MKHPLVADPRDATIDDLRMQIKFLKDRLTFVRELAANAQAGRNEAIEENRVLRAQLGTAGITRAVIAAELYGRDGAVYRTIHGDPECSHG